MPASDGNRRRQRRAQRLDGPVLGAAVDVGARAEAVGDAPPAHRDAAVGGALGVAVGVRLVAEQLLAGPPDLAPLRVGERRGHDDRGVHRQPVAAVAGEPGGEALQAAQHHRRPQRAAVGHHRARGDRRDPGALVDAYAALPHDAGDAATPAGPAARGRSRGRSGPDTAPATRTRSATCPAVSSPSSRCRWASERATVSTPLRTMSASMPSRAATPTTSSTVARSASRRRCDAVLARHGGVRPRAARRARSTASRRCARTRRSRRTPPRRPGRRGSGRPRAR